MAHILIADDDLDYIEAFRTGMASLGHRVDGVVHSRDVNAALAQGAFDIVFLDVLMPGGGAITLLHQVRTDFPDLPVVVLTGSATVFQSPIMTGGMRQADARISKTASLSEIGKLVTSLV